MVRPRRLDRVNQLILEEIAPVILELRDPGIGFITVVSVETSPDLRNATIFYSVLGSQDEKKAAREALRRASAYIRAEIMPRLHLRKVPKLEFVLDETAEIAARISELLTRKPNIEE